MDTELVKKFLAFMLGNEVKTDVLLDYKNEISVGEFHFVNGVHFPALLRGLKADGVYIDKEYIIDEHESDEELTLPRAQSYCVKNGCILPPPKARDHLIYGGNGFSLSIALKTLGFPPIQGSKYWAEGDKKYIPDSGSFGNVYADTIGCAPSKEYKLVRGCKRVSAKLAFEVDPKVSPYGWLLGEMLRPNFSYQEYLNALGTRFPVAGWYLTNDGTFSANTVYDHEAGICVTPNLFLGLNIHGAEMTAEETQAYQTFYGLKTPTEEQLLLMQKYAPQLNQALGAIDMDVVHVPVENITEKCWSEESLSKALDSNGASDEKRWYLPIIELKTAPEIYTILAELGVEKTV